MVYTTLFFDLDDTLYPNTNGLWGAIRARMSVYMHERVGIPVADIPQIRQYYFETYGTTLRGLQIHYQVNPADYLAYVHDLPLQSYLQPDPDLRSLLTSLPQPKWIFTNADDAHARRVIAAVGLDNCFEGIIDVKAIGYHCKPDPQAYQLALDLAGERVSQHCILLDDSPRNLAPAYQMGFTTVLIGNKEPNPVAHYSLARIHDLPQTLPQLWKS